MDLLTAADILIQGGGDRLAEAGLDYAALSAANPGLISVVVAPVAEGTPLAGKPAVDLTLMAMSGIMHIVGDPQHPPLNLPGAPHPDRGPVPPDGSAPAKRPRRLAHPDQLGRDAPDDGVVGHVSGDDA